MTESHVLVLNSGSSSLKFGIYRTGITGESGPVCVLSGGLDSIGSAAAVLHAEDGRGVSLLREPLPNAALDAAWPHIRKLLRDGAAPALRAVGHRMVHGGSHLLRHCRVDPAVLQQLEAATAFAPLHVPAALAGIRFAGEQFPELPQVACLDTSFHAGMPAVARTLPLPRALRDADLRRYGFHGLSCESIVQQLADQLPPRLIIAHLGNGASITAVMQGRSIDTSMGLTPTGGLIMGTRSGDLDPGLLVYLMRERQFDAAAIEALVDHHSGLLGISGLSADMRTLHQAAASQSDAQLAIDMFTYRAAKEIGAMGVAMGGVDSIVFTGGIGEHDASIRTAIGARLGCLGVRLDETSRHEGSRVLTRDDSPCVVQVLPSREDAQIARHTAALCVVPAAGS